MKSLTQEFMLAQNGNIDSIESIIKKFSPLMHKKSWITGKYESDCYQECAIALYLSIFKFEIKN